MTLRSLLAATLPFFVSACMVGPNFVPPDTKAAPTYAASTDAPLPADQHLAVGAGPKAEWWTNFGSPSLDSTVDLALTDNQDVAGAKARVAEAQESVKSATGALLPQLSVNAGAGAEKYGASSFGPIDITIPSFVYYTAGPAATFPTDLFGGGRREVERQAALAQYRTFDLAATRLSLSGNVATQALAQAAARAQMSEVQGIIDSDSENVRLVQTALAVGSANQTQLLTAQSQLAADRTLLPDLRQRQAAARHALAILVGKAPADWSPPDFALDDFVLPAEIPASVPSELAHSRPDILAAEAQLHAASAAIGVATAKQYPNLSLTASFAQQALSLGDMFVAGSPAWAVFASLTQPIFNGGQLSAEKRAAVDRYNEALAKYRQTVITAFGQVADSLQALTNDADQLHAQEEAAQTANRSLELARSSFTLGNTGILDVIDAQRRASQARLGLSRARAQRLIDTARLYLALGGVSLPSS